MLCPICHIKEGEWQCQTCRRIVCVNDARPTEKGVYCSEHFPENLKPPAERKSFLHEESDSEKTVKGAFVTLLFLTVGLGIIIYIGQTFVDQFSAQAGNPSIAQVKSAIDSLQSVGMLILYFMAFLTAVLGLGWFALSRQRKT